MAYPANIHVVAPSGVVRCGRPAPPAYGTLLDQIAAARPGSWIKANINTFQDSWPNSAWLPGFATNSGVKGAEIPSGSPLSPSRIITAWSSFAWDDQNMRVILFGGGHANSADNSVYVWEGTTRQWKLAFYPTRNRWAIQSNGSTDQTPVDGSLNGPSSAHTYSNQVWLPRLQRFLTFGGANHNSGASWSHYDTAGTYLRDAGPYMLDLTLAGQGYVGSTTGANVKQAGTVSAGVDLPGAHAWQNRDYFLDHPTPLKAKLHHGRVCCVAEENGHDVVYVHAGNSGATSKDLMRIEFVDNNYRNDIISIVGVAWGNDASDAQAAYDPVRKIFLNATFKPNNPDVLGGWLLKNPGTGNPYFSCPAAGIAGPDATEFFAGMHGEAYSSLYDERRKCFIVFDWSGKVFELYPPANDLLSTGWTVKKVAGTMSPMPYDQTQYGPYATSPNQGDPMYSSSVCGKWKRSRTLDAYVYLQHAVQGNIWIFKPLDWLDPRL
jgi:hypothetical protein